MKEGLNIQDWFNRICWWPVNEKTVDYEFNSLTEDTTYVVIENYGFNQTDEDLIETINDNIGGFTTVLDGLKAYLEHNIKLNLVADKFPQINQK